VDISAILTGGVALLAIATAVGYGLLRGRVTALRDELKDEREGRAADRRDRDDARAELAVVRNDLAALSRIVTGEAHWVAIGQKLDEHHEEAVRYWREAKQIDAEQLRELRRLGRGGDAGV
jgi:hypothetical protein